VPETATVRRTSGTKLAVTDLAASIVTEHVPLPEHAPPQPPNPEPLAGAAVRVTTVARGKLCEHDDPQLIIPGLLVTVPDPDPPVVTDNV
jgi:hypothetical protein